MKSLLNPDEDTQLLMSPEDQEALNKIRLLLKCATPDKRNDAALDKANAILEKVMNVHPPKE